MQQPAQAGQPQGRGEEEDLKPDGLALEKGPDLIACIGVAPANLQALYLEEEA